MFQRLRTTLAQVKVNTIFLNSQNSKTCDLHRLLFNVTYKKNFKTEEEINILFYQILVFTKQGKI